MPIHAHIFRRAILTRKVRLVWFWAHDQGSLVRRDYKSLCAAVTICSTLVNIQTHVHTHIGLHIYLKLQQRATDGR